MPKLSHNDIDILFVPISSPNLVGIYQNGRLVDKFSSSQKTSDFLIEFLSSLKKDYKISSIIYVNGPGSFMGIKVAFIILSTFCAFKDIDFFSISGFELTDCIRANKVLSFVKEKDNIVLRKLPPKDINLPDDLSVLNLSTDTLPNYVIEAV